MAQTLFRKKALEKLSSPDNIHELIQVTNSRSWLALLGLTGLVIAFLGWAIFGKLPKTVQGKGILIQSGGIAEVTLLGSGIVNQLLVEEGDFIQRNDTVAIVAQPELQLQIANAKEKLSYLKDKRDNVVAYSIISPQIRLQYEKKYELEDNIASAESEAKMLEEQISNLEEYYENKSQGREELNSVRLAYIRAQRNDILLENELRRINNELLNANIPQKQELEDLENDIRELRQQIDEITVRYTLSAFVKSPYEGKVIELMTKNGQLIEVGSPVISIEVANRISQDLEGIIYVSPDEGKKIKQNMVVRLAPSTVKVEEHGYVTGRVKKVSEYPSTRYGMARVLGNEDLVKTFSENQSPIALVVSLDTAQTVSGFAWTSAVGPALEINAGTLCEANIVIDRVRPISLLFPSINWK